VSAHEAPSVTVTCKCGAEIYTGPRDLIINGEVIAEKVVIDLNANHAAFVEHWQTAHPGEEMPERLL